MPLPDRNSRVRVPEIAAGAVVIEVAARGQAAVDGQVFRNERPGDRLAEDQGGNGEARADHGSAGYFSSISTNANSPLFGFTFPSQIALGNWLAGALLWHFAAMWLLVINGIVYVSLGLASGRFRTKLFPIRPREVVRDLVAALRGKLSHDDLSVYNAVQKLLYAGVLLAGLVIVLSGISIWKPVQFWWLTAFFGGYNTARYVHFAAMTAIVMFLAVHVLLALIVPKSLRAMIVGR